VTDSPKGGGSVVLVTDGEERSALATVRSLVAQGHRVFVAGAGARTLAGVSRGAHQVTVRADPLVSPREYAAEIGRVSRALDVRLLIPVTDASVEALLENGDLVPSQAMLPFPDLETFRAASDKVLMVDRARAAGLDTPGSVLIDSRAAIERAAIPTLFPAVLKPHRSVVLMPGGSRRKLLVEYAENVDEYRRLMAALPDEAFPILVQQRVRGSGEGLFVLRWNGRIVAQFAHRRLREKPPSGGVSVYRESIAPDPALVAASQRLLEGLGWRGVAMVECKRDVRTGRHVFMEINGRLWGSLQLAIDAGVDFPALLAACALGSVASPPARPPAYRVGVRSRWFWGDVDHLYLRFRRSARRLRLDAESPSRLSALLEFLAFWRRGDREEIWRWRDPGPFLLESARRLRLAR
jgi:predicted ATP-grasp superfamily ATP-dependent carboligase